MSDAAISRGIVPRVPQLDGLRGLAAVTVVFLHLSFAFHPHRIHKWFLVPLFTGSQAVILFFVLSGYVLSLPFWAGKKVPFFRYALSRIARIYLPFAVAAALSILGAYAVRNHPLSLTAWFNATWQTPITRKLVVAQFAMRPFPTFNTALWSLKYELQVSLVFPLLLWVAKRTNILVLAGAWLALTFRGNGWIVTTFQYSLVFQTLCITGLFLLGACGARYHHAIEAALKKSAATRWLLFAVSFYVYCTSWSLSIAEMSWVPCSAASLGLILLAVSSRRLSAVLSSRVCTYLGHVSYSLYLTHSVVLFGLTYLLHGRVPTSVIVLLILLGSLAFADVFHRSVEVPSIWLSRLVRTGHVESRRVHASGYGGKPMRSSVSSAG